MTIRVYNARYINDDHNSWDANTSYGIYTSPEAAQKALEKVFRDENDDYRWFPVPSTYTGMDPEARTWKLITRDSNLSWEDYEPTEGEEYTDDSGYGLYVIEEELRNG